MPLPHRLSSLWLLAAAGGCGFRNVDTPDAPRLIAPLSTAHVPSPQPSLRFTLPPGAIAPQLDLCRSRACEPITQTYDAPSTVVPDALAPGVWFWRVRATTPKGRAVSAVWQFTVGIGAGRAGAPWGSTLDFDGDGHNDLAISAPRAATTAGGDNGRVYLYLGSAGGIDKQSVMILDAPTPEGLFGNALATLDLDGDGYADLAVGAPAVPRQGPSARGCVYVYHGGPGGLAAVPLVLDPGELGGDDFGRTLAAGGDINGDGYADLIVGAPLSALEGVDGAGAAFVFYGDPLQPHLVQALHGDDGPMSIAGYAVAGPGDVDGDGFDDVLVGASGGESGGVARLYRGGPAGVQDATSLRLAPTPATPGFAFGDDVAGVGDLDGDGRADFAVGAARQGPGRVYLYGLGAAPTDQPRATLDGPDGDFGHFGVAVIGHGDLDGDGSSQLAIGASCALLLPAGGGCGNGRVYLYSGGAPPQALRSWTGVHPGAFFGDPLSFADFDGDGRSDLVVGSVGDQAFLGRVDVFLGAATGDAPSLTLIGFDAAGMFGYAIAD
jgi:hypothetical protein